MWGKAVGDWWEMEDERQSTDMVGSPGTQATWPMADSYRNRTTRRSKALKGTAQGVHQLAHQPIERATVRLRLFFLRLRHKNKQILRRRPVFKVHKGFYTKVRVRQGLNNNREKCTVVATSSFDCKKSMRIYILFIYWALFAGIFLLNNYCFEMVFVGNLLLWIPYPHTTNFL